MAFGFRYGLFLMAIAIIIAGIACIAIYGFEKTKDEIKAWLKRQTKKGKKA